MYKLAYIVKRRERNRRLLRRLRSVPCTDCGKRYPWYVMEFDHCRGPHYRYGKKKITAEGRAGISALVSNGQAQLLREIAKCDVVCANCHKVRTYKRRNTVPEPLNPEKG